MVTVFLFVSTDMVVAQDIWSKIQFPRILTFEEYIAYQSIVFYTDHVQSRWYWIEHQTVASKKRHVKAVNTR